MAADVTVSAMRLGLNLGVDSANDPDGTLRLVQEAERLGFDSVWAAEAYGSDAVSVLAWLAGQTERLEIGSAVLQIPARSPAMTAMTAATLDALSGQRFRLGLGVSGPQVARGWHGVDFADPLGRTREYVSIIRQALRREPLTHEGRHWSLPGAGGKPLRLAVRSPRPDIPIYLAAIGPKNLELAGEVADGWLAIFFAPEHAAEPLDRVAAGRARRDDLENTGFDVVASMPLAVGDDRAACTNVIKPHTALYVGGMGSRETNFYNRIAISMGYPEEAARIQDLYLSGNVRDATAAVPDALVEQTSLIGDEASIRARLNACDQAGATTVSVRPFGDTLDERIEALRVVAAAREGLAPTVTA
jgi:F420-dependent oxidoreductase-like protein